MNVLPAFHMTESNEMAAHTTQYDSPLWEAAPKRLQAETLT
jgi:hypothetical protein